MSYDELSQKLKQLKNEDFIWIIYIGIIIMSWYSYFLKDSFSDLKKIKPFDSDNKKNLTFISFVASLLIAISCFLFLYIAIKDEAIEVELAFN